MIGETPRTARHEETIEVGEAERGRHGHDELLQLVELIKA